MTQTHKKKILTNNEATEPVCLTGHAYTKAQFARLGFDTSPYHYAGDKDVGDSFVRLDCKRWGAHCMFLYLTTGDGDKIFVPVFYEDQYMGFKDIPIGGIVDASFDCYRLSQKGFICYSRWITGEDDPKIAEDKFYEDKLTEEQLSQPEYRTK